jgi:hypothetical protein
VSLLLLLAAIRAHLRKRNEAGATGLFFCRAGVVGAL